MLHKDIFKICILSLFMLYKAIVAITEKEIAMIGLRKTNSQSLLENNLERS